MPSGEMNAEKLRPQRGSDEAVATYLRDGGIFGTFIDWHDAPSLAAGGRNWPLAA